MQPVRTDHQISLQRLTGFELYRAVRTVGLHRGTGSDRVGCKRRQPLRQSGDQIGAVHMHKRRAPTVLRITAHGQAKDLAPGHADPHLDRLGFEHRVGQQRRHAHRLQHAPAIGRNLQPRPHFGQRFGPFQHRHRAPAQRTRNSRPETANAAADDNDPHVNAPSARSAAMALASWPSAARIASVALPGASGGVVRAGGVCENRGAGPDCSTPSRCT